MQQQQNNKNFKNFEPIENDGLVCKEYKIKKVLIEGAREIPHSFFSSTREQVLEAGKHGQSYNVFLFFFY